MDLIASDEQGELRDTARSFLAGVLPEPEWGAVLDSAPGWRPEVWGRLAELGWLGIALPEELDGVGLGLIEETIVVEEAGAALLSAPLLSTLGLLSPLLRAGEPECAELLSLLAAGGLRGTLADRGEVRATHAGGGWKLDGRSDFVADAERSDLIAVLAAGPDGPLVLGVEPGGEGVAIEPRPAGDPTRPLAAVELTKAPARLLAGPERTPAALAAARRSLRVLAAADAVGIAGRVLDLSVSYAREREQFDRPIGSYQAVSHQLADTYLALELSRSLVIWAALLDGVTARESAAAAAAAKAVPAAVVACETAIQVHGGIGTTWESPLHRYYKRALGLAAAVGPASANRAAAAHAIRRETG